MVSAPPGSGKTVLLRSRIDAAGLAERAEAIARDALGDPAAAGRVLEQAFDLAARAAGRAAPAA